MRGRSGNRHVRAEMELRPQEDDPQEQGYKTYTLSAARHVLTKTKLKMDWLQGQVNYAGEVRSSSNRCRLVSRLVLHLGKGVHEARQVYFCAQRQASGVRHARVCRLALFRGWRMASS